MLTLYEKPERLTFVIIQVTVCCLFKKTVLYLKCYMLFISKIQSGPLKISSVSEVMKESKQPASQVQKQKGDTPASTPGT